MRSAVRRTTTALGITLVFGLAGCGGSDSPTDTNGENGNGNGNGNGTGNGPYEVSVIDDSFSPSSLTVPPEAEVTWTWEGQNQHNVRWDDPDLEDSPSQITGTHEVTMPEEEGEYDYVCTFHQGMNGTIVVEAETDE